MKQLLLAAGLLLAAPLAHAQVRFSAGPQVGYTLSTVDYKYSSNTYDNQYRSGFSGGATAEIGIGHLSIRPAVLYAQKGYKVTENNITGKVNYYNTRIDYVTIPLNIAYTQGRDGQGIQVFAGGYLGYAVGGQYTNDLDYGGRRGIVTGPVVASQNVSSTSDMPIRRNDAGIQFGVGYRYHNFLGQLEYSVGLQNADPNNSGSSYSGSPTYHNRVFQLSLAYLFGPKL